MTAGLDIAWFVSSVVSAWWNGAATYYRGLGRALQRRGHRLTFYEPDALGRQAHRDLPDPPWARVVVYPAADETGPLRALEAARGADVLIKSSGVGVFDALLEASVPEVAGGLAVFWDVDAPATLARLAADPHDPLHAAIPGYDLVLAYGGGESVIGGYAALGARHCTAITNAVDPETHHPVAPEPRFAADLGLLANRLPDREARIRRWFFDAAARAPGRRFLLGGSGWSAEEAPPNVRCLGHVYTRDHNAFNASARAVLSINRESMARTGFSPATRIFEAAGAGACIISDPWAGIETFLEPGSEVLLARDGEHLVALLDELSPARARAIGAAARRRVLADHTYAHRARQLEHVLHAGAAQGLRESSS